MTLRSKLALCWHAYWALLWAKIQVLTYPSGKLVKQLGKAHLPHAHQTKSKQDLLAIKRCVKAVKLSQKLMPFHCSCLVLAIATQRLLAHANQPYELHLGLRKENGKLAAHAWITSQGLPVMGVPKENEFTPIAQFNPENQSAG